MTPVESFEIPHNDPDDPMVHAALAESEFAAQTKAALLQDEGIDAFVFAGARSWTGGLSLGLSTQGVPVWVRQSDLQRAKAALAQRISNSVDIDWNEVDVGEPEGDTANSNAESNVLKLVVTLGWLAGVAIILLAIIVVLDAIF